MKTFIAFAFLVTAASAWTPTSWDRRENILRARSFETGLNSQKFRWHGGAPAWRRSFTEQNEPDVGWTGSNPGWNGLAPDWTTPIETWARSRYRWTGPETTNIWTGPEIGLNPNGHTCNQDWEDPTADWEYSDNIGWKGSTSRSLAVAPLTSSPVSKIVKVAAPVAVRGYDGNVYNRNSEDW